jgi:hypothetical protein
VRAHKWNQQANVPAGDCRAGTAPHTHRGRDQWPPLSSSLKLLSGSGRVVHPRGEASQRSGKFRIDSDQTPSSPAIPLALQGRPKSAWHPRPQFHTSPAGLLAVSLIAWVIPAPRCWPRCPPSVRAPQAQTVNRSLGRLIRKIYCTIVGYSVIRWW